MLYGREATTPSLMLPLVESEDPLQPELHVKKLASKIISLQADAYTSAYKTKTIELNVDNSTRAPLPEFNVGDLVLYYQNRVGGRAHKLDSLWIGPMEVTFCQGSEYTVKMVSSGRPFARIHAKFLRLYVPPATDLEGGSVVNPTIQVVLIMLLGDAFNVNDQDVLEFEFSPLK